MERPRVVLFAPVYPPRKGGSATYFSILVDLMKDRVDFTVVCLEDRKLPAKEWKDGVLILRVLPDEYGSPPMKRYLSVIPRSLSVLRELRKEGPFILQAHSNGAYGFSASLFSKLHRLPMIKEVQDTSDPGWNLKLGKVNRYVSCGQYVKNRLEGFGIPSERIQPFTIINPPDTQMIIAKMEGKVERPDDKIRFIYIGWLMNRVKAVDVLVQAFRSACEERDDLELMMIGDGPDRGMIEDLASGYPIELLGELDWEEVLEWLLRSHVVVMASHEEAAGRSYIEGYAAGIPAIGTNVGGTPEVVSDGKTGILVKPGDRNGLKEAILKLADDKELRREMGENGKDFLSTLPGWDVIVDWYLVAYRSIMMDQ